LRPYGRKIGFAIPQFRGFSASTIVGLEIHGKVWRVGFAEDYAPRIHEALYRYGIAFWHDFEHDMNEMMKTPSNPSVVSYMKCLI
jgi:hypothetical protein